MGMCRSMPVTSTPGKVTPEDGAISKAHFDVERVIGQGGFAKVNAVIKCKGHDKGTWYAMKTLKKAVILERNHVSMVMKERNLLARLHCPQMVNMHYAFQDARNLYIIMDVCLGGDLHYQLTHAPGRCFAEEQAKFYAASIILCLQYMHELNVLHRDIKPENLLLDAKGQLKVTDLGISMELSDGVCTSTSGTRPYMAPEIFMSGHKHSFVADYYALGITVYQFLLGQRPYKPDAGNMKAIVRMATFVPPEKYTDVRQIRRILVAAQERKAPSAEFRYGQRLARFSSEARDFVQQCLICNPKYRLGSQGIAELMQHPWFAGIDWEAMREQRVPAPFVPDTRVANCAISEQDIAAMLLNEEEADRGPPIPGGEQARFNGFDYRTRVTDNFSGRTERIPRSMSSAVLSRASSVSVLYGERERAPTISVSQTGEALHSYSSYARGSSAWLSPGGASSETGAASPAPHASIGGSVAAPLSLLVTTGINASVSKRGSFGTGNSARSGPISSPPMGSPASPYVAAAGVDVPALHTPAAGTGFVGASPVLRSSMSGDPSSVPASPLHAVHAGRPASIRAPFSSESPASPSHAAPSKHARGSGLAALGASAALDSIQVVGIASPKNRRASGVGPLTPSAADGSQAFAAASPKGPRVSAASSLPPLHGQISGGAEMDARVASESEIPTLPGGVSGHSAPIQITPSSAAASGSGQQPAFNFDVVALSGLAHRSTPHSPDSKVSYPAFLYGGAPAAARYAAQDDAAAPGQFPGQVLSGESPASDPAEGPNGSGRSAPPDLTDRPPT